MAPWEQYQKLTFTLLTHMCKCAHLTVCRHRGIQGKVTHMLSRVLTLNVTSVTGSHLCSCCALPVALPVRKARLPHPGVFLHCTNPARTDGQTNAGSYRIRFSKLAGCL